MQALGTIRYLQVSCFFSYGNISALTVIKVNESGAQIHSWKGSAMYISFEEKIVLLQIIFFCSMPYKILYFNV